MSQPANDEFSQHLSDDEASNHEDASDTGAALHNNKVIQNGNSNKRISTGKDGGFEYIPQKHMRRFHGMDDAKEIWEAIRTRFGGNANSKKMQKALEAHGAEVSTEDANHKFLRSLPPAWSNLAMTMRTKPDVDTLSIDDLYNNLRVFEQEIQGASKTFSSAQNVAFVSQSKSSTNKVKSGFTGAYSTCTPSTSLTNTPEKEALAGFADEVIYSLFAKQSEDWDLLHEDLEQIDDLDIEEMRHNGSVAMIAIRLKGFIRKQEGDVRVMEKALWECTSKGTHDGKKKRDSFYQHQEAGKQEKNQMGLLTMDDGIVNWGEHTEDEETNHALMAISSSSEVSLCSKTCIDSYNTLKTLCDEQMNQLGDQEAQILAYRQAVTKLEAQLCKIGLEKDSVGKPLYSRFTKTNDFKGVPHLLSGDYTLNHKKKLMSPRCMFMIKRDPKSLKPSVSDDRSSEYSTCQSNDSAGSIRTSSVHSVDLESKISRVPQEVYVSKHTTTQMKKGKYSSTKKKCFVCGSLCHLIKDCDYYEKKMAREAGFEKQRVFNTGNMVAKPVWTNDDRINHDNQFVPRLVQLNAGRPNINSVRPNINTGIAWICRCKEVLISLCLRKPDESAGFAEIVDFLRGSNLRYALTTNPTIYDSLVKQFGRCYMPKLLADGLLELKQLLDTIVGQEALSITQPQPSSRVVPPTPPITQPIPSEATTILPLSQPAPLTPIAETTTSSPSPSPSPAHKLMEHTFKHPSSDQQPPTPRQEATTSQLMTRIDDLEKQLKETKQTFGKAILTLVERVKTLEVALKRKTKRVLLSDSEEEETEAQGRKFHDLDPLVSLVQELVTPSKTPSKTVNASGEEQVEDISPTTLEAAAILTKVHKIKSVDKGKRYKRRKSSKEFAGTGLDFEEVKSAFEKVSTGGIEVSSGIEEINTGSLDVNTGIDPVTTDSIRVSVPSPDRGRREGKAPMIEEEETQASRKTKEQILQEEARLAKAISLDALEKALEKEEVDKQVHLDLLLAQRMAEEQELTEEQKKRKAQVQFEAQSYTKEDWDTIRAKLEANAELKESVLGKDLTVEDYAKRMVELVNQRRKHFAEERARAIKNKPMTQTQHMNYMLNFLKNQGTWKLNFEEVKAEFEKLVKQLDTYVPMNFEATKESLKRFDLDEANEKDDSTSGTKIPINPILVATKSPSIPNYKDHKQGKEGVIPDSLQDCHEKKHGLNEPEMNLKGQQRIICWRYYDACRVHCLNLESADIYMLIERKYPLSAEVCKAMLDKKLQGGKLI
ncbi:hypothetical protein Tco_1522458 [Tanacetum coccineum]